MVPCRFLQYGLERTFKRKPVLKKSGYFFRQISFFKDMLTNIRFA